MQTENRQYSSASSPNKASDRRARTTNLFQRVLKVGLYVAIVLGAILGIPPFVRAVDSLIGMNITQMLNGWLQFSFATGMTKACLIALLAIGGYGVWQSSLPMFKKFIGLALVGLMAFYIFGMTPEAVATFLLTATIPLIGAMIWGVINITQIFMLVVWDDDAALKKLMGKIRGRKEKQVEIESLSPIHSKLSAQMSRDRVGDALALLSAAGVLSYVVEIAVNLMYGDGFLAIDWGEVFRPGGFAAMGFRLLMAVIQLLFTVGSIEYCVRSLQKSDDLKDAIES